MSTTQGQRRVASAGGKRFKQQAPTQRRAVPQMRASNTPNPYIAYATPSQQRRRKQSRLPGLLAILAILLAVGAAGMFIYSELTKSYEVTVNGEEVTVERGDTIATLIEDGVVTPATGNLLAVDGSVLEVGGGEICSATIDGEAATVDSKLPRAAVIQVGNGADVTEEATTSDEPVPAGTAGLDPTFDVYWAGSIHLLADGKDGVARTTTGNVSGIKVQEIVEAPIDKGYHVYTAKPDEKVIALTFDDGPWPETTDAILDILEANGAKATFFTIGNQIADHTASVKRAHDMGCQIATHSWDHAAGSGQGVNLTYMTADEQLAELQKGYDAIENVIGVAPSHVLRAPGGNFYGSLVDVYWPYVDAEFGWDVDTEDWRLPGADAIAQAIMSAQSGQIILMHDGGGDRTQTVEALRQALPYLVEQGYKFVTVDEMLAYGMPPASTDA